VIETPFGNISGFSNPFTQYTSKRRGERDPLFNERWFLFSGSININGEWDDRQLWDE
jgi:hypothetical protein